MQFTTALDNAMLNSRLLSIKQRYKLNAIHNYAAIVSNNNKTVVNKAKIQIECNSQPTFSLNYFPYNCCQ